MAANIMIVHPHQPQTFDDAQRDGTLEISASSMTLGWQGIFANHFKVNPEPAKERVMLGDSFVMHIKGSAAHLRRRWNGRWESGYSTPQSLCMMPGKATVEYGFSNSSVNIMYGVFPSVMTNIISEIGKGDPEYHQIRERFIFRDPLVEQIGWTLIRLLHEADDAARLYAESLGVTLAHHMLRFYSLTNPHITHKQPAISHPQIRNVLGYMEAHFTQPIALADLAQSAGLSVAHFSRLFRQATGYSPHQYLVRLRCEHAYKLLMMGKMSITEVAQAVGFYDHSHFVRHFKRIYGVLPTALRTTNRYPRD